MGNGGKEKRVEGKEDKSGMKEENEKEEGGSAKRGAVEEG